MQTCKNSEIQSSAVVVKFWVPFYKAGKSDIEKVYCSEVLGKYRLFWLNYNCVLPFVTIIVNAPLSVLGETPFNEQNR